MASGSADEPNSSFVRPDPGRGQIGDARYAEHYVRSHGEGRNTLDYRSGYVDVLTLDALMPEGYRLLDVGCGTAGYHHLLARHGHVTGIDPIPEMIMAANQFKEEFSVRNSDYACLTFEEFKATEKLDAIRLTGVYGWYLSWHRSAGVLAKAFRLLDPAGIAVLSYVPPKSPVMAAKAILAPARTVVIFRRRFLAMVGASGFVPMFEIRLPHTTVLFARKPAASPDMTNRDPA